MPPNATGFDVSAELPNAKGGFETSAEPPKKGGFEPSVPPPNIGVDLELSVVAPNMNVGFFSVELPPKTGTGFGPPVAPPNNDAGLDPSADLEPELVTPNENTGVLPEEGGPAGVEESVPPRVVVLVDASVDFGGVEVEAPESTATEGKVEVDPPKADTIPNGADLTGSFKPVAVPSTDTGTAGFFDSSVARTVDAELPSDAPGAP